MSQRSLVSVIIILSIVQYSYCQDPTYPDNQECFMLLVGKKATRDGTVLLAHNNDLTGKEPSILRKYPAQDHAPEDSVYFPSGLAIPQVPHTYEWLALQIAEGFKEGDAVAINEHGVAIAGGVALKADRNSKAIETDPLIKNGLTGGVRYIALQRSRTARECVKKLGALYNQYGVTYPSGIGIADTSEIWYIESGGGHSWAAVRVPDSCYWVQANGYRIGYVDPTDTLNYYCSPFLHGYCELFLSWNPAEGEFNFAKTFGGGRVERNEKPFYDLRRIWQAISILTPSLQVESDEKEFPLFIVPDQKISLFDCFSLLRNRYEGTQFENNVDDSGENAERPIASWNAVHTNVIQLWPNLPVEYGSILWTGLGPPQTCYYVPVPFGVNEIPELYRDTSFENDGHSGFWIFHNLATKARSNAELLLKIKQHQAKFEQDMKYVLPMIHAESAKLFPAAKSTLAKYLTIQLEVICKRVCENSEALSDKY